MNVRIPLTAASRAVYATGARAVALWWAHSGPTPRSFTAGTVMTAVTVLAFPYGLIPAALFWLALHAAADIAADVHEFAEDDGVRCRFCPAGNGGGPGEPDLPDCDGPLDPFTADAVDAIVAQHLIGASR